MADNPVASLTDTVTIAATAGTATFSANGIVLAVVVSPVSSPSAANAALKQTFAGVDLEIVASEAVSTTASYYLYNNRDDSGVLGITAENPLKVVFDTATNDDQFTVTLQILRD